MAMIRPAVRRRTPAWKRLAAPAAYLRIRHDVKPTFDFWWPLVFTAATTGVFWWLPVKPAILGDAGFLKGIRELISLFAAFFVIALAAVSTFDRTGMDRLMPGTPPRLGERDLTQRQFVCYLFGYLAILSFVLFIGAIVAEIIAPSLRVLLSPRALGWTKFAL